MRKQYLFFLMGCITSWTTNAQSFQNETAVSFTGRDVPAALSANTTEAVRTEIPAADLETSLRTKQRTKIVLGYTRQSRPVEVYYFPGLSNNRALIIGGMHGSELSSIEIAKNIIGLLSNGMKTYYDVLIIPSLFPDNAVAAQSEFRFNSVNNAGRYTTKNSVDPNRQMPCPGQAFEASQPLDFNQRTIEKENQYLLRFIQDYKPSRIINLHAIRDLSKAGIYADPRTDCNGLALGFESDSTLAVSMAQYICHSGGSVPGNHLQTAPTALYYNDPSIAAAGNLQKRNLHGSPLPDNRGCGVSLGGWATSAVCSADSSFIRNAMRLITVEFPGYKPPSAFTDSIQKEQCLFNIQLYSAAIVSVFLSEICEE
jgi:hypothetical protein